MDCLILLYGNSDIPVLSKLANNELLSEIVKKNIDIETIFFPCSPNLMYLSSSLVREMARYQNTIGYVPNSIVKDVEELYK